MVERGSDLRFWAAERPDHAIRLVSAFLNGDRELAAVQLRISPEVVFKPEVYLPLLAAFSVLTCALINASIDNIHWT